MIRSRLAKGLLLSIAALALFAGVASAATVSSKTLSGTVNIVAGGHSSNDSDRSLNTDR